MRPLSGLQADTTANSGRQPTAVTVIAPAELARGPEKWPPELPGGLPPRGTTCADAGLSPTASKDPSRRTWAPSPRALLALLWAVSGSRCPRTSQSWPVAVRVRAADGAAHEEEESPTGIRIGRVFENALSRRKRQGRDIPDIHQAQELEVATDQIEHAATRAWRTVAREFSAHGERTTTTFYVGSDCSILPRVDRPSGRRLPPEEHDTPSCGVVRQPVAPAGLRPPGGRRLHPRAPVPFPRVGEKVPCSATPKEHHTPPCTVVGHLMFLAGQGCGPPSLMVQGQSPARVPAAMPCTQRMRFTSSERHLPRPSVYC